MSAPRTVPQMYEVFFTFPPERDLSLQYSGEELCPAGHLWQGIRNHFLIHYVVRGSGRVMTCTGMERLSPGDGFLFFPGQRCWYKADNRQPWTYTWVGFTGTEADRIVRQIGFSEERTVWRAAPDSSLKGYFRRVVEEAHAAPGSMLRLTGLLYLILERVGLSATQPARAAAAARQPGSLARAFRFVELHYGQDIRVSDIARHVGLERTYFSALFKRETGQTPAAYLLAYRMALAENLLAEEDLSVKEIAFSVGFQDYFAFAKRFKKLHARTPSEFRAGINKKRK